MKRFAEKIVRLGFVTACLLAATPTSTSLSLNATTDGVVRLPSAFGITTGSPPSITATQEFVVPRSIPMILDIGRNCEIVTREFRVINTTGQEDPSRKPHPFARLENALRKFTRNIFKLFDKCNDHVFRFSRHMLS